MTSKEVLETLNYGSPLWLKSPAESFIPGLWESPEREKHTGRLRYYVDLWLATGRDEHGVELASSRKPTPQIDEIVQGFFMTHRAFPIALKDGYAATVIPPVTLQTLHDERTVETVPLALGRIGEPGATVARGRRGNLFDIAEDAAQRMFVSMLMSRWRLNIAKCRRLDCAHYFLIKRPNQVYKMGTLCRACGRIRSFESAAHRTDLNRKKATQQLYRLVAAQFSKKICNRGAWHEDAKLKSRIVRYLNERIERTDDLTRIYHSSTRSGITVKWLGRSTNRLGIERAIKDGGYAKG